jgi:hypothetical protein
VTPNQEAGERDQRQLKHLLRRRRSAIPALRSRLFLRTVRTMCTARHSSSTTRQSLTPLINMGGQTARGPCGSTIMCASSAAVSGGPLPLPRFGEVVPRPSGVRINLSFSSSYEGLRSSVNNVGRAFVETSEYRNLIQQTETEYCYGCGSFRLRHPTPDHKCADAQLRRV